MTPQRNLLDAIQRVNTSVRRSYVSRLPPIPSEPLADKGAIATLRTPRAAAQQDGTSSSLPAQGCDGAEIENAVVERERLGDAALVAG
jgi:hypothetical protein